MYRNTNRYRLYRYDNIKDMDPLNYVIGPISKNVFNLPETISSLIGVFIIPTVQYVDIIKNNKIHLINFLLDSCILEQQYLKHMSTLAAYYGKIEILTILNTPTQYGLDLACSNKDQNVVKFYNNYSIERTYRKPKNTTKSFLKKNIRPFLYFDENNKTEQLIKLIQFVFLYRHEILHKKVLTLNMIKDLIEKMDPNMAGIDWCWVIFLKEYLENEFKYVDIPIKED